MKLLPFLLAGFSAAAAAHAAPLALHPDNPHYFILDEKPAVLVSSGEHYGAVLNQDFDFVKYLKTLADDGLNLTRTFSGAYVEPEGAFKIAQNTLAPKAGRFICPWARSSEPGYRNGGNKFDLTRWDDAYFSRLKEFMTEAAKRGVVVELDLFCPMYDQKQWDLSPMNAANNVNGIGKVGKHEVHTLDGEAALLETQLALVRKLAAELNDFDNLYYEVCNEPYFGGVTQAWHDKVAETVVETERALPKKHLISWNVANGSKKVEHPHPAYSIFNFHYANPPAAVAENYALNKPAGLNETGFKGTGDDHYRMEAWEFMLAGGALYNHLDYSFTVGHEDGTFAYPDTQPGGGNPGFRRQIGVLKRFIEGFDFVKMKPARELLVQSSLAEGKPGKARWQLIAEPERQFALYVKGAPGVEFHLDLPAGTYRAEWIDIRDGHSISAKDIDHAGGAAWFEIPAEPAEVAARIVRLP